MIPQIGIMALLAKAGSDGRALLLHHRPLVRDRFGGAHIADKLLYYCMILVSQCSSPAHAFSSPDIQELISCWSRGPEAQFQFKALSLLSFNHVVFRESHVPGSSTVRQAEVFERVVNAVSWLIQVVQQSMRDETRKSSGARTLLQTRRLTCAHTITIQEQLQRSLRDQLFERSIEDCWQPSSQIHSSLQPPGHLKPSTSNSHRFQ